MSISLYFGNTQILQNTLLPYFDDKNSLALVNKLFNNLNYEKYTTPIQPHGLKMTFDLKIKKIKEKANYKNGKLEGLYEKYYKGKLGKRCNYKNGKLDGLYEEWWCNDRISMKYNYKNGKLHGLIKGWDPDGELNHKFNYVDGKLQSNK